MKPEHILNNPTAMLAEIEAYLSFRLLADVPCLDETEMRNVRADIIECLARKGLWITPKHIDNGSALG